MIRGISGPPCWPVLAQFFPNFGGTTVEICRRSDSHGKAMVTTVFGGRYPESPAEREARIRRLAAMVKQGAYVVESQHLATALLEWDPKRTAPRAGDGEGQDRRRAYMRDYMRKRRAGNGTGEDGDTHEPVGAVLAASATGPPGMTGLPGP